MSARPKLSANIATIPPGGVAYAHIHVGFELILYILKGRVRHEFGPGLKKVLENEAGDFIYIKPGRAPRSLQHERHGTRGGVCRPFLRRRVGQYHSLRPPAGSRKRSRLVAADAHPQLGDDGGPSHVECCWIAQSFGRTTTAAPDIWNTRLCLRSTARASKVTRPFGKSVIERTRLKPADTSAGIRRADATSGLRPRGRAGAETTCGTRYADSKDQQTGACPGNGQQEFLPASAIRPTRARPPSE